MTTMGDLANAIEETLSSNIYTFADGDYVCVPLETAHNLQAEYNIHFREPDEEQLSVIPDK